MKKQFPKGQKVAQNQNKNVSLEKAKQERRNKIYAYILAVAMVFWTLAGVLGIVGFATSVASADEVSTTYTSENVVARKRVAEKQLSNTRSFDEGFIEFSLLAGGATACVGGYDVNSVCTICDDFIVSFYTDDGGVFVSSTGDSTESLLLDGDSLTVSCNVDFSVEETVVNLNYLFNDLISYKAPFYDYINDTLSYGCCPLTVEIDLYLGYDEDYDTYTLGYYYDFLWYEYNSGSEEWSFVGRTTLEIDFGDAVDAYGDLFRLTYPSLGVSYRSYGTSVYGSLVGSFTPSFVDSFSAVDLGYDLGYDYGYDYGYTVGEQNGVESGYDNGYDEGYDIGYEQGSADGYDEGYDFGFNDGLQSGYESGYNYGYDEGYYIGELTGYEEGVVDANTYTFENLLTSVIDVPVRVFTDMFNFEILGVNLSAFFFGLLTVCTIIAIIRLFFA